MWYIYGDFVIDGLLGLRRCRRVTVYFDGTPPARECLPSIARNAELSLSYTNSTPPDALLLDRVVFNGSGEFLDRNTFQPVERFSKTLLTETNPDFGIADALRLLRLAKMYPELGFPTSLLERLESTVKHLQTIRSQFDWIHLLLLDFDFSD